MQHAKYCARIHSTRSTLHQYMRRVAAGLVSAAAQSSAACKSLSLFGGSQSLHKPRRSLFCTPTAVSGLLQTADTEGRSNDPQSPMAAMGATAVAAVQEQQQQQQQQQQEQAQQQQQEQAQQWTPQQKHFMNLAFQQARKALRVREVPIGCVVVRDGQVVGSGFNMTNHTRNATRHAELEAIDRILADHEGDAAKADFSRCQLYVTIEPCIMCAGALSLLGFQEVYYGAANDKFGGCGSIMQVHESGCGCCSGRDGEAAHGRPFKAMGGLFAEEAIHLLQQFYVCGNPTAPKPKRTVVEVPPWQLQEPDAVPEQQGQ